MAKLLHTSTVLAILVITIASAGCSTPQPSSTSPTATPPPPAPSATPSILPVISSSTNPYTLISQESMFAFMRDLTAIQPHSGWRNSGTQGEAEAMDYVQKQLGEMQHLQSLGLELERQSFHVFLSVETWETQLHFKVDGKDIQVPADSIRGHRDDIAKALRFDSDRKLNDSERNPAAAEGAVILIRSQDDIEALSPKFEGKIVCVDFNIVSDEIHGRDQASQLLSKILAARPAGLLLVTEFSDQAGKSHGIFIADGSAFYGVTEEYAPPTLYTRLEDLTAAGINGWDGLTQVESARMVWDADVFSPGTSGNLVARIPGADSSRAVILGGHIDSPNNPGAMDDGSGSVVLLEVARVLNVAQVQPATDIYLVWFGSEELGLYGAYHFAATHQELLDRTLAMLQTDMLAYPMEGMQASIDLVAFPYTWLGDNRLNWPNYLTQAAGQLGIETNPRVYFGIESDNSAFDGFGVPNANMIYGNSQQMERLGSVHYASHIHSPYDTVNLAQKVGDVLEQMARVALIAALETGQDVPDLRVSPVPDRRALFVASHTEPHPMAPTALSTFGMTLGMNGFDVDMIPYGQAVTPSDLDNTDVVIVLPVVDYPSPEGDTSLYDEAWSQEEIAALEAYVAQGGLLVLTNSAHRLKYGNMVLDPNEDWADVNALAERFGVYYQESTFPGATTKVERIQPLMKGLLQLELAEDNAIPFTATADKVQIMAKIDDQPTIALLSYQDTSGQVMALADVGILGAVWGQPINLTFWQSLAWYIRSR